MSPAPKLRLEQLSMTFAGEKGDFIALAPVNLDIPAGRFVSLIGPSGCGKTTIFNVVAGLLAPTTGRVLIDGEDATGLIGQVSYMLQKDLLLPWRTVLDNVALGIEIKGVPIKEARECALPLIQRYGLGGFEHRHPSALSGGMRQRAALLRTLLIDMDVILLDEPFGALDAQTRLLMGDELLRLWRRTGATVLLITHALDEATMLADRIGAMSARPGRFIDIIATGWPRERDSTIVAEAAFGEITGRLWERLRGESLKALGHSGMTALAAE
jgi:ABC-type nitrate/sulfonate/bicarbonate transport system ATPase subunit